MLTEGNIRPPPLLGKFIDFKFQVDQTGQQCSGAVSGLSPLFHAVPPWPHFSLFDFARVVTMLQWEKLKPFLGVAFANFIICSHSFIFDQKPY